MLDLQPLSARDLEPVRIEPEQVQHRRVDVGDVVPVLDGVETQLVGRAVHDASLDAAAGHPDREAVVVVVAAVGALAQGVRPNSVAQTTIVSSSKPRCFRSVSNPAIGLSTWAQRLVWLARRPE